MEFEDAKQLLLLHGAGKIANDGSAVVKDDGFLGTLRPYKGLDEENFHEIMEALFAVSDKISESHVVDCELVKSIWWMCYLARLWGVNPNGMIRRNQLISPGDVDRLDKWIDVIEYFALHILNGSCWSSINMYAQYICDHDAGRNVADVVPLLASALNCDDFDDPSTIVEALGKLGAAAQPALPQLRNAAAKTYRQCHPVEQCTAEVRQTIHAAIARIEGG